VGCRVGVSVGASVGLRVGDCVGASVGFTVGACDGASVGATVGDSVGDSVGELVGAGVEIAVSINESREAPFELDTERIVNGFVKSVIGDKLLFPLNELRYDSQTFAAACATCKLLVEFEGYIRNETMVSFLSSNESESYPAIICKSLRYCV
jgi:hypothetical protein